MNVAEAAPYEHFSSLMLQLQYTHILFIISGIMTSVLSLSWGRRHDHGMNYKLLSYPKSDFYQLDWSCFQFASRFVSPIIDAVRQVGFQRMKQFLLAAQRGNQTPHLQARVEQTRGSFFLFLFSGHSFVWSFSNCDLQAHSRDSLKVSLILLRECHFVNFFGLVYDADSSYAQNFYFDIRRVCIINLKKKIASYCNVVIRCYSCRPNLTKFS
jgi:hypothetical protein